MSNYDKFPVTEFPALSSHACSGWKEIFARWRAAAKGDFIICIETYPGVATAPILEAVRAGLEPTLLVDAAKALKPAAEIETMVAPILGDDPVFGRMNGLKIDDFLAPARVHELRTEIASAQGLRVVVGTGASLFAPNANLLAYADLARWEIQLRQRRGEISNLGAANEKARPAEKYKRAYFIDWRAADRLKRKLWDKIDFFLDTHEISAACSGAGAPKLVSGPALRGALATVARRPFRVVPFFDPGPWGGQWMKNVCGLPDGPPNYAWCFDCVPEENSLLLGFGETRIEIPSIDLVFAHPVELLGDRVHARFGAEFPIRFDFLDTMEGGNLSLQVHPLTEYIQDNFGIHYTQDESYYMLDAAPGAEVYLGLKTGVDREAMARDLRLAQEGGAKFPDEKYVNRWPAKKHDHFLIPGGTVHCSGANGMVLEISATPYIFTFKLWDWGRLGLDGRPRPIHLEHGLANIQWNRQTDWVREQLVNRIEPVAEGDGWREERTGLHEREFIETRRHWFTKPVTHHTGGGVNVLNLVEGSEAIVESPTGAFPPFSVHYAETFIIPASVGEYVIRPATPNPAAPFGTIKAYVRA